MRTITHTLWWSALERYNPSAPKTGFRTPEKRRSGVTSGGTRLGDPHPHALSLASAGVFRDRDGVLHTVFSADGLHRMSSAKPSLP